jgi:hypothetical protein
MYSKGFWILDFGFWLLDFGFGDNRLGYWMQQE